MIPSFRERGSQAKQEGENGEKTPSTSSRQWSAFRNPRIVRVSSSFGGKDRHSKVCTIRGLRDRRIRLSVPTAIQLYDLQDRLGLNQPSKVIDWLLDATKDDIDKLPPLQIPQGFGQFHQPMLASHDSSSSQSPFAPFLDANAMFMRDRMDFHSLGMKISSGLGHQEEMERSKCWEVDASLRGKCKEVEAITERGKWIKTNEQENEGRICNYEGQFSAQNLFPVASHSSLPGSANNLLPFNSYYQWDAPNLSLSQFGGHGFPSQAENTPSSQLSLCSGGSQFLFCPPAAPIPSLFPPYPPYVTTPVEVDQSREINHFQLLGSSSQHILTGSRPTMTLSPALKPFSLNESQPEKDSTDS